jgi:hypothetical protein
MHSKRALELARDSTMTYTMVLKEIFKRSEMRYTFLKLNGYLREDVINYLTNDGFVVEKSFVELRKNEAYFFTEIHWNI